MALPFAVDTSPATFLGCDSATPPSPEAADAAYAAGVRVWQVYIGGPNATHTYTTGETETLRAAHLTPLAIWVPSFELLEDPRQAAADAVGAMEARGIYGAVALDTEYQMRAASHLVEWVDTFTAHVPSPSVYLGGAYAPNEVARIGLDWGGSGLPLPGHGFQYGPAEAFGMSVDWDRYSLTFPFSRWTVLPPAKPAAAKPAPAKPPAPTVRPTKVVAIVGRPQGDGYWLVDDNGALHAFGKALGALARTEHDRLPALHLDAPVVAGTSTPTGLGLHLATADGTVYRLGDALDLGDLTRH